jgi:hypothetical protein
MIVLQTFKLTEAVYELHELTKGPSQKYLEANEV